jgi:bifunctional non-homologous end joining protein LigD
LVWAPPALRRVNILEKKKIGEYLVVDSLPGLIGLVQMDVLEIHTWNSTITHLEQPDRIIFDLDPGPNVSWAQVVDAARLTRSILKRIGLTSFVKTTGGVGLHVVVPLVPGLGWPECFDFSRDVAETIVRLDNTQFSVSIPKRGRESKILIDYLRNNRANTSVAAYSTRATRNASVSTPLSWDELSPKISSDYYTAGNLQRRLTSLKNDPWAQYESARARITAEMAEALPRI